MKRILWILPAFVTVFCFAAVSVIAAETHSLEKSFVSGTAEWVHHFDVQAFWRTDIGIRIREEMPKEGLDNLAEFLGSDLFDDFETVTLYGTGGDPSEGVVVIRGHFDRARLLQLLEADREHGTYVHNEHTVHSWVDRSDGWSHGKTQYGAFAAEGAIFISRSRSALELGLDVFDGEAPDIRRDERFAGLADIPAEAFSITCIRRVGDIAAEHGQAVWLKNVESFCGYAAEQEGMLKVAGRIRAVNEDKATHMQQVLQGMISIAMLHLDQSDVDWRPLLQSVDIKRDGSDLNIDLKYPSGQLLERIRKHREEK